VKEVFFRGPEAETALVNYVRKMADLMGLKDWQFFIKPKPTTEYLAYTHIWGDSKTADLNFSEDFFNLGPAMQREVVCHELMHWHHDVISRYTRASFREHVGGGTSEQFRIAFMQHEELMIDAVASAWARQLPVIDWHDNILRYCDYEPENALLNDDPPQKDGSS
jgi:hypothetical protein